MTSFFSLLKIKGFMCLFNSINAVLSLFFTMGVSYSFVNLEWVSIYPGIIKSKMYQSSVKEFSIGVPVSAKYPFALISFTEVAFIERGFFIC